jgi:hypothetical protein
MVDGQPPRALNFPNFLGSIVPLGCPTSDIETEIYHKLGGRFHVAEFAEMALNSMTCGISGCARQFPFLAMSRLGSQFFQQLPTKLTPQDRPPNGYFAHFFAHRF